MAGLLGVTLASSALAFTASSSSAETSSRTVEMASSSTEATAADETQDRKIDFCHKNENQPNYVFLSLPIPGVMGHISETAHKDDIIPSFTYTDKDSKQEVTFPGRNLDKSDYIGRDCKGKDGDDDWNDVPTWVTVSGIVTCHLVGGVNDGTWDITWTAKNDSPSGKMATVTGVEPANATPPSAEIPSGGSKDFAVNASTAGAQTLVLKGPRPLRLSRRSRQSPKRRSRPSSPPRLRPHPLRSMRVTEAAHLDQGSQCGPLPWQLFQQSAQPEQVSGWPSSTRTRP